jgi:hypothetical protein
MGQFLEPVGRNFDFLSGFGALNEDLAGRSVAKVHR